LRGCWQGLAIALASLLAQTTTSATFGDVIRLPGGTLSDVVLDSSRHQLYLVNNTTSQVYIYDYNAGQITGSITVGKSPLAGAISMTVTGSKSPAAPLPPRPPAARHRPHP
jgi:DNA-binding beta-propeller fold protein YncE